MKKILLLLSLLVVKVNASDETKMIWFEASREVTRLVAQGVPREEAINKAHAIAHEQLSLLANRSVVSSVKTVAIITQNIEYYKSDMDARVKGLVDLGFPEAQALEIMDKIIVSLDKLLELTSAGIPLMIAIKIAFFVPESIPYILNKPKG